MTAPTPAEAPFDQSAAEAYAAIFNALRNLEVARPDAERYAFAAQLAAAPILRADGVALAVSRIRAMPADHHYERSMIVAERCARVAEGTDR